MAAATRPGDTTTTTDSGGLEFGRLLLYGLALASLAAGIIHFSAAVDHASGNLPWHAGLFVVSAVAQFGWAGVILRRSSKRWLLVGLVVNLVLVLAWVLSRSTGVPLIPAAQEAEPLGFKDVTTAFFELAVVIGVGLFAALPLAVRRLRLPAGRLAFEVMLTAALLLVFLGLSQTPHSHGGPGDGHGEAAAASSDHHAAVDATGHDTAAGDGHMASAGHSQGRAHRGATTAAEAGGSGIDHPLEGGHDSHPDEGNAGASRSGDVHQIGSVAADPHGDPHHADTESAPSGAGPSGDRGHSPSGSAPVGQGRHDDGDNHPDPGASGGDGGHNQSGGHGPGRDHGGPESDPAPEELIVKAFFSFINTVTKAAGLGPV